MKEKGRICNSIDEIGGGVRGVMKERGKYKCQ